MLSELLRTQVKDPRLEDVSVSEVEMSGDLGVARVYYTTLDPDASAADAEEGFRAASGFLRGRIGHALHLRRAPELHFVRDNAARRGAELTRLIDSLRPPESEEASGADEDGEGDGGAPPPRRDPDEQ